MRVRLFGLIAALAATLTAGGGAPGGSVSRAHAVTPCTPSTTLTCEELVALGYAYPYAREEGAYLFVNGAAYRYAAMPRGPLVDASVRVGSATVAVVDLLHALGLGDRITRPRTPVIAYGSNATVSALTRKYVNSRFPEPAVIPVTRAQLRDYDVVWSPHLVFNGAMPATIVRSPGTIVEVWINWLDDAELRRMHESEEVGTLYSYGSLAPVRLVSDVPLPESPRVYVDCHGALAFPSVLHAVAGVSAQRRRFPAFDSEQAMRRLIRHIDWTASVFELLLDNVQSPERRAGRTHAIAQFRRFVPDPAYHVDCPCGTQSCPVR